MLQPDASSFAEGTYRGAIVVSEYMDNISRNVLSTLVDPTPRETALYGMFLRATGWARTLKKLNEPTDVQAIVACNRSLLEVAVDIVLLHSDATESSAWHWWEQSAKLKSAKAILAYYAKKGMSVPESYSEQASFAAKEEATIVKMRNVLWPQLSGGHPNRWTGKSLDRDVLAADNSWGDEIATEFGESLTEFYETEYRRMNWNVHGSGLAGIRNLSPDGIHALCGLGFKWCADLAMLCTKAVLVDFRFATHLPDFATKWEDVRCRRLLVYADSVGFLTNGERDSEQTVMDKGGI